MKIGKTRPVNTVTPFELHTPSDSETSLFAAKFLDFLPLPSGEEVLQQVKIKEEKNIIVLF